MAVSDNEILAMISEADAGLRMIFDGYWKLKKAQTLYHGGVGAAMPTNLSDVSGGGHKFSHKTKEDIDAGLMWFGEVLDKIIQGDGEIVAVVDGTERTVVTKPGQIGNILRSIT